MCFLSLSCETLSQAQGTGDLVSSKKTVTKKKWKRKCSGSWVLGLNVQNIVFITSEKWECYLSVCSDLCAPRTSTAHRGLYCTECLSGSEAEETRLSWAAVCHPLDSRPLRSERRHQHNPCTPLPRTEGQRKSWSLARRDTETKAPEMNHGSEWNRKLQAGLGRLKDLHQTCCQGCMSSIILGYPPLWSCETGKMVPL